ncbi:hypothetical protein ACFXKI_46390 [Streptomyces mirabilis]|uniref:hypothetical protein n=1 Tax=Streptomyces mirabilis TaxID=68239 RepID=UPI00367BAC89
MTSPELHALQQRLPWSREAHEGWEEERGRLDRAGRESTKGWEPTTWPSTTG